MKVWGGGEEGKGKKLQRLKFEVLFCIIKEIKNILYLFFFFKLKKKKGKERI